MDRHREWLGIDFIFGLCYVLLKQLGLWNLMSAWKICCFCIGSLCVVGVWIVWPVFQNARVSSVAREISFNSTSNKIDVTQEKLLITGVCRDTERAVPSIIENAEKLGNSFKDYAVIIYENNSRDHTAALYAQWAKKNPHVIFVSETLPHPSTLRTQRIADARNIVLSIARRTEYQDFKYLVMVDVDFVTPWPIERIIRNIERGGDWDMIAANGINPMNEYYDRYALRNYQFPFGPELLGDPWWWMEIRKGPIRFTSTDLIPVYSAFGGLAIYKTASLLPFEYSGTVNDHLFHYYKQILIDHNRKKQNPEIAEYIRQIGHPPTKNLKPIPIVFVENAHTDHPEPLRHVTCCEHVTMHASMAMNGHGKFFIDPQMVFIYTFE